MSGPKDWCTGVLDDVKSVEYVMLNSLSFALTSTRLLCFFVDDFNSDIIYLVITSKTQEPQIKVSYRTKFISVLNHSNNNMSGTENQQPSLVGAHAEYVKGAAEVSLSHLVVSSHRQSGECQVPLNRSRDLGSSAAALSTIL